MSVDLTPSALTFAKGDYGADPLAARVTARPPDMPRLLVVPEIHPLRAASEACIRTVYARAFGAHGLALPRLLLAWVGPDDRPLCAAGLRTPADGFFSEAYLNGPIERALKRRCGQPVARESVIEITTMASRSADASIRFIRQVAALANEMGFAWSFFTATARLRSLLNELGIPIFVLAEADPARMAEPERWGSYYRFAPHVCAVKGTWLEAGPAHA